MKNIADLPDNCAGRTIDVITARRRARRNRHQGDREPNPAPPLARDDIQLHHCRFQDLAAVAGIKPGSVNLICTDIPYQPEFLPQISELAAVASELLTPVGLLVTYSGKLYLPEVLDRLGERLTYRWMLSSIWSGEGSSMRSLDLVSRWKPILVFSRGKWEKRPRWYDVLKTDGKEKQWHPWQQPLAEVEKLIEFFSRPGDLVVDTCGGGFAPAVACLRQNRRFIGCDCEAVCVSRGQQRLKLEPIDVQQDEPTKDPVRELIQTGSLAGGNAIPTAGIQ